MTDVSVMPDRRLLVLPYSEAVKRALPGAMRTSLDGADLLLAPHGDVQTRILRQMGTRAPAPIVRYYDWSGTVPFKVQRTTAAMLTMNARAYVLNEIGTGKTRSALYAFDWLRREKQATRMLVIAPLSTLTETWAREVFQYFPHLTTSVVYGEARKRRKLLEKKADIYIINHDGLGVVEDEVRARKDIDVVCIDELAVLRNPRSIRWKVHHRVLEGRRFVWGMTGAPTPNEPTDAYGQIRLLTPSRVPKFEKQFRSQTMVQISQFKWVARAEANDIVHRAMQPSVRFTRDQCLDLPPVMYEQRDVKQSSEQAKVYKMIYDHLHAEFEGGKVTAANEGVKLNKLLQVGCGFVYGADNAVFDVPAGDRFKLLWEIMQEAEGKVLIFCPFIQAVQRVDAFLEKKLGSRLRFGTIHGQTPPGQRNETFRRFRSESHVRAIVAHPKTMSHGLTLTEANTVVWFSPIYSLEVYEQANGRITRPGQTRSSLIVHISGSPVEREVYRRLQQRSNVQGALLDMFRGVQAA